MRFREFYQPLFEDRTVGRELQHLEDLVFTDGSAGALEALDVLKQFQSDVSDVSIKWDGTPAVIFGRNESGEFILTDIAGFGAKNYNGRVTNAQDLANMILSRGSRELTDERRAYAAEMAGVWSAFESATPAAIRGFFHGDLLYKETPPVANNHFVFTPNKVTYSVKADSSIGQRIARSRVGVVVHTFTDLENNRVQASADSLREGELFIMPPVIAQRAPKINLESVAGLEAAIKRYASGIDSLLAPKPGLSDIKNIIYTYVNQMSREGRWNQLVNGFEAWLQNSKVSPGKQTKIRELPEYKYFKVIFDLVLKIQALKNDVIEQLDQADQDVVASIGGERGGEGYVAAKSRTKLVPRHRFRIGKAE
jgi:hypothetical protein